MTILVTWQFLVMYPKLKFRKMEHKGKISEQNILLSCFREKGNANQN